MSRFLFLLVFFFPAFSQAQVINVEHERFLNDSNGWMGRINASFQLMQNVERVTSFGSRVHIQWKNDRQRWLFLNDVNFIATPGNDLVNSGYQHMRWNYKIHDRITWEAFAQGQYNRVLDLRLRALAGTGPRFKLLKTENAHIYAAALYMFEHEETVEQVKSDTHRMSSYLTFVWKIGKHASFSQTTFWQPALNDFSDYRIAHDSSFGIGITKHLEFQVMFNLLYDTRQPAGIPATTYQLRNALEWHF